jgi:polysaccharide export outer membrane protein
MYIAGKDPVEAKAAIVSPGDSVYVQRAGVVYVLGAVGRPGGYLMVNGGKLTVPQAIALAQGTTIVASNKEVLIVRKRDGQITRLVTSLKEQETGRLAVVALTDGDMLYVPTSKIKAALVNSSAVISSAASAGIVVGLQKF